ncbi:universal stress protein [Actinacidiphila alni]|uniref:universal stress protein n=1 Tax=Actinacidiphila alni TaxID=380248 RepID=UPI0033EB50A8
MKNAFQPPESSSVVVGVDGSQSARAAALWAAGEAVRRGRPLHIVHGADTDGRALYLSMETIERARAAGRELLADTADAVRAQYPGLHVTKEFSRTDAVSALHQAGGRHGTIVVGSRGLGGFGSLMLGSVGLDVVASATTPVIVVRSDAGSEETGTVLVALGDESDLPYARYAAREAELRKGALRLLHVSNLLRFAVRPSGASEDVGEEADVRAEPLGNATEALYAEFPHLKVRADAEKSISVAGVLIEASRDADLLVMGGRRVPGPLGIARRLGRATHSVLHHAQCPVLLLPRTADGRGSGS